MRQYLPAGRVRKYYKYASEPWTQPVFSGYTAEDGSVISASQYDTSWPGYPYGAMDGKKSGSSDVNWWSIGSGSGGIGWWKVQFPYKIVISKLVHYNRYNDTYASVSGQYFADEARTVPIGNAFASSGSWAAVTVFEDTAHPVVTDTIYFSKTDSLTSSGIGELEIDACRQTETEATSDDYDFYKDECVFWTPVLNQYHLYDDEAWTQPVLSADVTPVDEGDITVSASSWGEYAYRAMDGLTSGGNNAGTWWETNNLTSGWWKITFPYWLRIRGLVIYSRGYNNTALSGRCYTSESMLVPIGDAFQNTSATSPWNPITITGIPEDGIVTDTIYIPVSGSSYVGIGEVVITAGKRITIAGTPSHYDYVTLQPFCSAIGQTEPPATYVPTLCTGTGLGTTAWSTQSSEQYRGSAQLTDTEFGCMHGGKASNQNTVVFTLASPVKSDNGNYAVAMRFTTLGNGYTQWFTLSATYTDETSEVWVSESGLAFYNTSAHYEFYTEKTVKSLTLVSYVVTTGSNYYNVGDYVGVSYMKKEVSSEQTA